MFLLQHYEHYFGLYACASFVALTASMPFVLHHRHITPWNDLP